MNEYIYASSGEPLANIDGKVSLARNEIVRCRDCADFDRWDYADGSTRNVCARFQFVDVTPDGFCAWGERKVVAE